MSGRPIDVTFVSVGKGPKQARPFISNEAVCLLLELGGRGVLLWLAIQLLSLILWKASGL